MKTMLDFVGHDGRAKTADGLKLELRYSIVDLLCSPNRRMAAQLFDPKALDYIKGFATAKFPFERKNILRRFLSGELTDGVEPIHIPRLHRGEVEKMLRALDVIEALAREIDRDGEAKNGNTSREKVHKRPDH